MPDPSQHLRELEKLVEDNRVAFERAKRLLVAMKERSSGKSEEHPSSAPFEPAGERSASLSSASIQRDSGMSSAASWLDLEKSVRFEVSSEVVSSRPIAAALSRDGGPGWRAPEPGMQTIRLVFAVPHSIQRIQLVFLEENAERTQEFVLRWLSKGAAAYREIVRQQYAFTPLGSTREVEDYEVDLTDLVAAELCINPDLNNAKAYASLARLSLAGKAQGPS